MIVNQCLLGVRDSKVLVFGQINASLEELKYRDLWSKVLEEYLYFNVDDNRDSKRAMNFESDTVR